MSRGRKLRGGLIGVAALLAVGVAVAAQPYPPLAWPSPSGPYAVGTRDFEIAREVPVGKDSGTPARRRTEVRVWYPAQHTRGFARREYFNAAERAAEIGAIADILGIPQIALRRFRHLPLPEFIGAPPATAGAPFPVIVFNHGYWLYLAQNTALMEHLASHGYVVFSLSHAGDSAPVAYSDGTIGKVNPYVPSHASDAGERQFWGGATNDLRTEAIPTYRAEVAQGRLGASFRAWREDTVFFIHALDARQLPATVRDLLPEVDTSRLGLAGMSFGGSIAASVCRTEPSCGAAVNMDGDEYDFSLYDADYPRPLLLLCSDWIRYPYYSMQVHDPAYHFDDYAYEQWATAGLSPTIYRIVVRGIQHVGFTDLILSLNRPLRDRIFGKIAGTQAIPLTNDFVLAFFDRILKHEPVGFPARQLAEHPLAYRRTAAEVRKWWRARNPPVSLRHP